MSERVLVAYATKHGATAEIAERIGEVLRRAGLEVDVRPAGQVDDLAAYGAVVLGSAAYIGRWRKSAAQFLKAHADLLAQRPVWIFSSGPTGEGDPEALAGDWRLPEALEPVVERIRPRAIAVFHGAMDAGTLNFIERWIIKNVGAPLGDFRDWDVIEAWAASIGHALRTALGDEGPEGDR
jgi:menaquinone-dependent protoporphyrinogen oxidase